MPEYYASFRIPDAAMDCWLRHFFAVVERRKEMTGPCTCLPRSPDDQCPTHGYEEWLRSPDRPLVRGIIVDEERETDPCCYRDKDGNGFDHEGEPCPC